MKKEILSEIIYFRTEETFVLTGNESMNGFVLKSLKLSYSNGSKGYLEYIRPQFMAVGMYEYSSLYFAVHDSFGLI